MLLFHSVANGKAPFKPLNLLPIAKIQKIEQ